MGKGTRPSPTTDYSSIRPGNYATAHRVIFGFENEKLDLSFDSYNMYPFAGGILDAAVYLHNKSPGFYTIEQAFGLKD
jgi:4-hydroxy-tetrahydrodipicolinate reductase